MGLILGVDAAPAGGGGGFAPTDLSGLKLWLKAGSLALSDGDAVGTWADSSGSGNDATQATAANKPLYKAAIVNGLPVVRFDGLNDYLVTPNLGVSQPDTVFVVGKQRVVGNQGRFLDCSARDTTRQLLGFHSGDGLLEFYAGSTVVSGTHDESGAFKYVGCVFNGASSQAWVNGVSEATGNPGANSLGVANLGWDGGATFLDGDIAELIVYNSALGTTDRQSVESYLAAKYGL